MAALLREQVRTQQYDFYILSLFFPITKRSAAWAILAFYAEVMAIADKVTEPLAGAMRLAWWRDKLAGIYRGEAIPQHPVLQAMAEVIHQYALPASLLQQMIEAAACRMERDSCPDMATFEGIARQRMQPLFQALALLEEVTEAEQVALWPISTVDGMLRMMRALPEDAARGYIRLPLDMLLAHGLSVEEVRRGEGAASLRDMYIGLLARMDELLLDSHKDFPQKRIINTFNVYIKIRMAAYTRQINRKDFNVFSVDKPINQGMSPIRLVWALMLTE